MRSIFCTSIHIVSTFIGSGSKQCRRKRIAFERYSSSSTIDESVRQFIIDQLPRPRDKSSVVFGNWVGGTVVHSTTITTTSGTTLSTTFKVRQPSSNEIVAIASYWPNDNNSRNIILEAARDGFDQFKHSTWEQRACILDRFELLLESAQDILVDWIVAEVCKPIRLARIEVTRAIALTRLYAIKTRQMDMSTTKRIYFESGRYSTQDLRPKGPVFAVTPFNFPLNLLLHKFLPAIAAGTSIVVKPTPRAPITAYIVGQIAKEAGYDAFSIVNLSNDSVAQFVQNDVFSIFTFTGGAVGWDLAKTLPVSTIPILELGSNAAIIVNDVTSEQQLGTLCDSIVQSAFGFSGQSCISTQRVLVHSSIASLVQQFIVDRLPTIEQGHPENENVWLSSMISESATLATIEKVKAAQQAGAIVITATGDDNFVTNDGWLKPLLLLNTKPNMDVNRVELFAPVMTLLVYDTVDEAIELANDTNLGLHVSIVSDSQEVIATSKQRLKVRGIIVNDVPSIREDYLPYGGVGLSGFGCEGVATGIEDYSESTYTIYPAR